MRLLFCPMVPCIRKHSALFRGSQPAAACLYDKSSAKLMTSMEHGLSATDTKKKNRRFRKDARPVAILCKLTWPGLENATPKCEGSPCNIYIYIYTHTHTHHTHEGWNFNFGNTPLDWIQELLE